MFWALLWFPTLCVSAFAAATNDPDAIPPLRPPRGEIGPTLWEEHGVAVIIAGVVLILLVAVVVWFLTRPKPVIPLPPEALARQELEPLRQQPEQGEHLSRVSHVTRHYLATAFELPAGELTTAEFCEALSASPRPEPEFSRAVSDFLRRCDERKFALAAQSGPPPPLDAASAALKFIGQAEARLAELRAAQAAHSTPGTKGK